MTVGESRSRHVVAELARYPACSGTLSLPPAPASSGGTAAGITVVATAVVARVADPPQRVRLDRSAQGSPSVSAKISRVFIGPTEAPYRVSHHEPLTCAVRLTEALQKRTTSKLYPVRLSSLLYASAAF